MIEVKSDWDAVDRELARLERMPTTEMTHSLNAVLDFGFGLTQAAVHVETGALKASGKKETNKQGLTHEWHGSITYGDSTAVDYAIYEKRRGVHWAGASAGKGDHDFMRPLEALHPMFVAAILKGLHG